MGCPQSSFTSHVPYGMPAAFTLWLQQQLVTSISSMWAPPRYARPNQCGAMYAQKMSAPCTDALLQATHCMQGLCVFACKSASSSSCLFAPVALLHMQDRVVLLHVRFLSMYALMTTPGRTYQPNG